MARIDDDRGFEYVVNKRKRPTTVSFSTQLERAASELHENDFVGRVARLVQTAHHDAGFAQPFFRLLCLGIGSPVESRASRTQLALVLALAGSFNIPLEKVAVYEPAFSDQDLHELAQLGLGIVSKRKARHLIDADGPPTLLYMPHCDREVIEAFLGHNWQRDRLARFILVGNHLVDYNDILPEWKFKEESPCVFSLSSRFTAWKLPPLDASPSAFNNISVQFFPSGSLALPGADDSEFWALPNTTEGRYAAPVEGDV
ncbi:hypothetical protein EXIGLDRAFT_836126 [Exidia glandulosa HHB12029]|uniref:SRR1-like domain-containing protein n=1 Tax=Exidia glandulosa HHB12029 TaxID=1314781 RepID=A0A166AKN4_EXIGL|nr:hypothetical protein EXIGLDRAFT_836126 [Exidia glandulosa HHB12029]